MLLLSGTQIHTLDGFNSTRDNNSYGLYNIIVDKIYTSHKIQLVFLDLHSSSYLYPVLPLTPTELFLKVSRDLE